MARRKATITDSLGRERTATRRSWGKIDQLPSGNYRASYPGPDGQRHRAPVTFSAKVDADSWLATQRAKIAAGDWISTTATATHAAQADRSQTFRAYATEWIRTRTNASGEPLRDRTREEYQRLLRSTIDPLADLPLTGIKAAAVRGWYSALVKSGKKTTAARAYGFFRSVMNTAVQDGLLATNPVEVRGAQNATTGRKTEPPTDAELAIIEATMPERLRTAVIIAAWGALRFGEMTELRRRDIETRTTPSGIEYAVVNVSRAVTHTSTGFVVGTPKSAAGVRVVPLPPGAISDAVKAHLDKFVGKADDALLFPSKVDPLKHMGQPEFGRSGWHAARAAAGRDNLPWHGLRHFGLTRYAQAGATSKELLDRAGHTTVGVALRYQHAAADRDAELAARMTSS